MFLASDRGFVFFAVFVSFASPVLSFDLRAVSCPDAVLISPCVCTNSAGSLEMVCDGLRSLQNLADIFGRTFPTNELHSLVLKNSQLGVLANDVFRGKSFEKISFIGNRAASFQNAGVLSSSKNRLTYLLVQQDTDSWTFDFANVADAPLLEEIQITGYDVSFVGVLSNLPLLSTLTLQSYLLTSPPQLSNLPALSVLNLDGSVISTLPTNSFSAVPSIRTLYLGHNKLVSLDSSSVALAGPADVIDLSGNLIAAVAADAISGIYEGTTLMLVNNYLRELTETVFRPIVGTLSQGSGKLMVDGNSLDCGCTIGWLIANPDLLTAVPDGRCINGTRFQLLDPNYYIDNC